MKPLNEIRRLSGFEGPALAAIVVLLAAVSIWIVHASAELRLQPKLEQFSHLRRLSSSASSLAMARQAAEVQLTEALPKQGTEGEASAQLISRVTELSSEFGLSLNRVSSMSGERQGDLKSVRAGFEIAGMYGDVLSFLEAVQAASPLLLVETITLRAPSVDPATEEAELPLTVELVIATEMFAPADDGTTR